MRVPAPVGWTHNHFRQPFLSEILNIEAEGLARLGLLLIKLEEVGPRR